jgi:hypothetical protein
MKHLFLGFCLVALCSCSKSTYYSSAARVHKVSPVSNFDTSCVQTGKPSSGVFKVDTSNPLYQEAPLEKKSEGGCKCNPCMCDPCGC